MDDNKLKQPYQGHLIKFTNVVKGWQSRWFLLDPESGTLQYHLSEGDRFDKARGGMHLAGAVISPSYEDSHTFTVSPADGESYKLRAQDTKDRQMWINRLRIIAEMHTKAIGHYPSLGPRENRRDALPTPRLGSLDVLDAFTQVAEIIAETQRQHSALSQAIEELPSYGSGLKSLDANVLLIKATSQATLSCLDQCICALRSRHSAVLSATPNTSHLSPHPNSKPRTAPQSPSISVPKDHLPFKRLSHSSENGESLSSTPTKTGSASNGTESESEVSDCDNSPNGCESGVEESERSVLMHIVSQLRLGMDLTRVTLPTFILEKRSLLEMFADFLGLPHLFLRIAEEKTPQDRMLSVVRWYLTSIHVGRQGSTAKKPYNPIIGETFFCSWRVPASALSSLPPKGEEKYYTINYRSEQVSHHPPVSAFFFECPELEMCINAHIWTKSKFMGMSIGVNLIGSIQLVLGEAAETYQLAMPSAYARSVLTDPWVELGGRVLIQCSQAGFTAPITFHTKPFYGGKLHHVTCEVKNADGTVVCRVQGEWDSELEFSYEENNQQTITIGSLSVGCRKRVRRLDRQLWNESRRLWRDVTRALASGDLETATNHKKVLEDHQRAEEQIRLAAKENFPTKHFSLINDLWVYNELPSFARHLGQTPS